LCDDGKNGAKGPMWSAPSSGKGAPPVRSEEGCKSYVSEATDHSRGAEMLLESTKGKRWRKNGAIYRESEKEKKWNMWAVRAETCVRGRRGPRFLGGWSRRADMRKSAEDLNLPKSKRIAICSSYREEMTRDNLSRGVEGEKEGDADRSRIPESEKRKEKAKAGQPRCCKNNSKARITTPVFGEREGHLRLLSQQMESKKGRRLTSRKKRSGDFPGGQTKIDHNKAPVSRRKGLLRLLMENFRRKRVLNTPWLPCEEEIPPEETRSKKRAAHTTWYLGRRKEEAPVSTLEGVQRSGPRAI